MISSAEETAQRRRSAEPPQQTTAEVSFRDGLEEDEFLNKVCKFELISRGKTSPVKSPTGKGSAGKLNISAPDNRSGRRSGENFQNYAGEKLFTKDTATTRVSASILQTPVKSPKPDPNTVNNQDLNPGSFGSVSTRRKSGESRNSRSSTKSTGSSGNSPAVVSGAASPSTSNVFFSGPISPVRKTELPAAHYFENYVAPKSPGVTQVFKPGAFPTDSKFSVQTPEKPSGGINVKPQLSTPVVTVDAVKSEPSVDINKQHSLKGEVEKPQNSDVKDLLKINNNSEVVVSRNTFEGIDFDFNELTESQKDLTLKHREIVAERKQEQEMERLERMRLEEILSMCADYERQIEDEKKHPGKKFYEMTNTTAEWATPPIPPLPLQYQHLQNVHNTSPPNNKLPGSPRTSQSQSQGYVNVPTSVQNHFQSHAQAQGQSQGHVQTQGHIIQGHQRTAVPPAGLDLDTHSMDRKEFALKSEYRSSMTNKIMTNGSLTMLSSPTNAHKDFFHGYQMRKCGSNSSNSEEESICGSSEDTGTIKRRPNSNQGQFVMDRPTSPRTLSRSMGSTQISKFNSQSMTMAQSDQSHSVLHRSSSPLVIKSNEPISVQSSIETSKSDHNQSGSQFSNSFRIEPLRLTNVSIEFVEKKQFENLEPGSHNSTHSEPECDLQLKENEGCELQVNEPVINSEMQTNATDTGQGETSKLPHGKLHDNYFGNRSSEPESTYHGSTRRRVRNSDHHDYVNIPVNGAHFSDSSSASSSTTSTVCAPSYHGFIHNILSTGSPRSSGSMSGSKSSSIENVTPMNSDSEFTLVTPRIQGSRSSSTATTDSSECSIGTIDVSTQCILE